ncbi:hypothetical protein PLICRDRAFT_34608 [Plicaturopsis crispa FD-325 SS-3]|nr:hypothetical protein PLICRDRAFT_34608 [Plicaturopsis crispa FD-325 SS-3]
MESRCYSQVPPQQQCSFRNSHGPWPGRCSLQFTGCARVTNYGQTTATEVARVLPLKIQLVERTVHDLADAHNNMAAALAVPKLQNSSRELSERCSSSSFCRFCASTLSTAAPQRFAAKTRFNVRFLRLLPIKSCGTVILLAIALLVPVVITAEVRASRPYLGR